MPSRIQDEAELRAMLARGGARVVGEERPAAAGIFPVPQPAARATNIDHYRSKTERLYAQTILDVGVANGILKRYWYEAIKLQLGHDCTLKIDFLVEYTEAHHKLELQEVKGGFIREDSMVKLRVAAAMYPCFRIVMAQWKDQRWWFKEVPAL